MQKILTAVVLVALTAWVSPAAGQNREHQQQTAELRMLQEQATQLSLSLAQLADAIKALNARMDATDEVARKRHADQELLIKELLSQVSAIRERSQDTDTRLRKLADEIDALRTTVTSLPSLVNSGAPGPVESSAVDPNAPAVPGAAPPAAGAPAPSTAGLSPSRMLDTARSDYYAGAYAAAITGFEALLKAFPRTEAASEGQYLLGEAYSQQRRWQDAVGAYSAVIQNYPKSTWVPNAYYKRGRAQEQLGLADAARASYELLMKTYPDAPEASLAKQALDRTGRQPVAPRP